MKFEFFKKSAAKAEKTPEQERMDKQQLNAGIALAGVVAAAGVSAYEIHKMDEGLKDHSPAAAEALVPAENPTIGMKSTDAPKPVTVELPHQEGVTVHLPEEKGVTINLTSKEYLVKHPES
jgi:hypothetical protein